MGIATGLAAVLEPGLKGRWYIHLDSGFAANRAAHHHNRRLLALYPERLPSSAIRGCFGKLPPDVTLISEDDLCRLGQVDMVITRWPCRGHSQVGGARGLDDSRSGSLRICLGSSSSGPSTNQRHRGTFLRM